MSLFAYLETATQTEQSAGYATNPLLLEPTLDLSRWCRTSLPSDHNDWFEFYDTSKRLETRYQLASIVQYVQGSRHFVNYSKVPDAKGELRWAKFDDLATSAVWEDPLANQVSRSMQHEIQHLLTWSTGQWSTTGSYPHLHKIGPGCETQRCWCDRNRQNI